MLVAEPPRPAGPTTSPRSRRTGAGILYIAASAVVVVALASLALRRPKEKPATPAKEIALFSPAGKPQQAEPPVSPPATPAPATAAHPDMAQPAAPPATTPPAQPAQVSSQPSQITSPPAAPIAAPEPPQTPEAGAPATGAPQDASPAASAAPAAPAPPQPPAAGSPPSGQALSPLPEQAVGPAPAAEATPPAVAEHLPPLPAAAPAAIVLLYPAHDAGALNRLRPIAERLQHAGMTDIRAKPVHAPPQRRVISYFYNEDRPLAEAIAKALEGSDWPHLNGTALQPSLVLPPVGVPGRNPGTIEVQLP